MIQWLEFKRMMMIIKNIITNTTILFIGLSFISCSNMTVGFEEDSPLYNGPIIDTREDKAVEPQASKASKEVTAKKEIVTETKEEKQVIKEKISTKQEEPVNKEATPNEENETTFSYDPNDGD